MPRGDPGAQGLKIACGPAQARVLTCGATLPEFSPDGVDHSLPTTAALIPTGEIALVGGTPYGAFAGLALRPQHWPAVPNHSESRPITQHSGETFNRSSRFCFFRKDPR